MTRVFYIVSLSIILFISSGYSHTVISGNPASYIPGQFYYGRNQYIEYIAGNLPFSVTFIVDNQVNAGYYEKIFSSDASGLKLSSGTYFCVLNAGAVKLVKKMVFLK